MAFSRDVNADIPFYGEYFHAISRSSTKQIFSETAGAVMVHPSGLAAEDVTATKINPLKALGELRPEGDNILIPLRSFLVVPDTPGQRFPLVIIIHGAHRIVNGTGDRIHSYNGYQALQNHLADNGIASWSIDAFLANFFDNEEPVPFDRGALDFNQRILHIFLHLKLLRLIAGEAVPGTEFPVKYFTGGAFRDVNGLDFTVEPGLNEVRTALFERIDFTRIGLMGHSRGADAVARTFAYFYRGGALRDRTFPVNAEVERRITELSVQIGQPSQDTIKCILALEPTAYQNRVAPEAPGYVIDNNQTMFFLGVGTHDEDVSFDAVRLYEYPTCPKVMVAVNGATHGRFNTVWADDFMGTDFDETRVQANLFTIPDHTIILSGVFGLCFTATLNGQGHQFVYFTKEKEFDLVLSKRFEIQTAWKFPSPFDLPGGMIEFDSKVSSPGKINLETVQTKYKFEQEIEAFYREEGPAGSFSVEIPVNTGPTDQLPALGKFSFRFAKGFDLSSNPDRIENKNFTVQLFNGSNQIGRTVQGSEIEAVSLKAIEAFDEKKPPGSTVSFFEYSLLLQTVEISFNNFVPLGGSVDFSSVRKIVINIVAETKLVPGLIGAAFLGAGVGALGMLLYMSRQSDDEKKKTNKYVGISAGAGAIVTPLIAGAIFNAVSDDKSFAFIDFLITEKQALVLATP